ncbi:O-acyltransferase WSD1 C-terminal domain-containing protein [Camponotus japonicus]
MQFAKSVFFNKLGRQKLQQLFAIILAYLFTPLILVILNFLYIYRCLIKIILRIQFKDKFVGFLKGTDCVWANEDAVCLSVLNILIIIEKTEQNSNVIFLEGLKNLIHDRIVSKTTGTIFEKLFYRRRQKFGYYFWERNEEEIDLNNRIRWLECENADCDGSCEDVSSEFFKKNLGSICNKTLPDDHTAAWEILVGKRCSKGRSRIDDHSAPKECFHTDTCKIPLIFRIHHSLGDGITLLRLFETIIDEDKTKIKIENMSINANETNFKEFVSPLRNSEKNLPNETRNLNEKIVRSYKKNIFAASMSFTTLTRVWKNLRGHFLALLKYSKTITIDSIKRQAKISINHRLNFKDICLKQVYEKIKEIMHLTMIILLTPKCMIEQACSIDENSLHGPSLTGEKIISYWLDDAIDKSQKLLMKVREIKKKTSVTFEDVVLTAFSASVQRYHLRINKPAPDSLTAVLPIRMTMPDKDITFDNNFSVARLRICISKMNGQKISEPNKDSQFFKRLQDITKANNEFKKCPNILINFLVMKYVLAILPAKILKLLLLSQSTMVFSNIYGPEKIHTLNNYLASNLTFWLPNKGATALGFSLISYGGNLNLSLIADKSIINDEKALTEILEDTVREIDHAYNNIILTCF